MHRSTPSSTSFRSYVAGGAKATVDKVDNSKLMQESSANFTKGETRKAIESPENYGFTSHNFGKDESGGGECTVNFMGGNRSFPVMGPIGDRRHRVCEGTSEGDSLMHRGKDDDMQIHLASDGMYHSAPQMVRMQLVPKGSAKKPPPSSGGKQGDPGVGDPGEGSTEGGSGDLPPEGGGLAVGALSAGGGSSGGGTGQQQQGGKNKPAGQKAVNSAGKDSKDFMHVKSEEARLSSGKKVRLSTSKEDDDVLHESSSGKDYVGGTPDKHKFSKILTLAGPSVNGFAKIG
jgi:hypothetical protein